MVLRFIDTNVFLRYFTRDDEVKARNALSLLSRLEQGTERATTSPLVIFETIFTLQSTYKQPKERVVALLTPVLNLRNLKVPTRSLWRQAFDVWLEHPIQFADAYNVAYMRSLGLTEAYTYDRGFDHVSDIRRLEPGEDLPEEQQAA